MSIWRCSWSTGAIPMHALDSRCGVLVHEYVALDLDRAVEALDRLEPVESFIETVRRIESSE